MSHDAGHERWLEDQLHALLDENDPEVQRRLAECRECVSQWTALRAAADQLEQAGLELREDLRLAAAVTDAPGEELIRRNPPGEHLRPHRSTAPWLAGILAIAASIAAWVVFRSEPTIDPTTEPAKYLGDQLRLLAPIGSAADFSRFRWEGTLPPDGAFIVIVRGSDGVELFRSGRIVEHELAAPADLVLPDEIEWRVECFDSGGLRESAIARATRR